jgi:O-acetyl-ADP-ribose deacetylase (regulator of RNase III)
VQQITIVRGDITTLPTELHVDCIVNAANAALQAGGGVCGSIFRAAGLKELSDACEEVGPCGVGDSRIVLTPFNRSISFD